MLPFDISPIVLITQIQVSELLICVIKSSTRLSFTLIHAISQIKKERGIFSFY